MSQAGEYLSILEGALRREFEIRGIHLLYGSPSSQLPVRGKDLNSWEAFYCIPKLQFKHRLMDGNPQCLYFRKNYEKGKVEMVAEFEAVPSLGGKEVVPMKLSDFRATLVAGRENPLRKSATADCSRETPQTISLSVYLTLEEFRFVKEKLTNGQVSFEWMGAMRWHDISQPDALQHLREKNGNVEPSSRSLSGTLVAATVEENNASTFGSVRGLLNWEMETIVGKDDTYVVWFKDTMEQNTYYFLPQIYWIKADPRNNKPLMTMVASPGADPKDVSGHRILLDFSVAPYYHPRAERDLYSVVARRSAGKLQYCNIEVGGYESARFDWDPEFIRGFCHDVGINPLYKGEVSTAPDTSFSISLECTKVGYSALKEKLFEGLKVGSVIFPEQDDMKVSVVLNIHRLANLNLEVQAVESTNKDINFPYQAILRNYGSVGLEIGDCELSSYAREGGNLVDVRHHLACGNTWPVFLGSKKGTMLQMARRDILDLLEKTKKAIVLKKKYWTHLDCAPHTISLPTEDAEMCLAEYIDQIHADIDLWTLHVRMGISPELWEDIAGVEVKVSAAGMQPEVVFLDRENRDKFILMGESFKSFLSGDKNREYTYQMRLDSGSGYGPWTDPKVVQGAGTLLEFYDRDVEPLM